MSRMTLGWFTSFTGVEWDGPFSDADESPFTGRFHVEMAKTLERAGFDFILLDDTAIMVPHTLEQSFNPYLRLGSMAPKHDLLPLAAMMAAATERIGIVATVSTMFSPPFMAARLAATLDHLTASRFGWNVVTSAEDSAAQNFGLDVLPDHDLRYDMADEYLDLVQQLWGSWDQDNYVRDHATSTYVSPNSSQPRRPQGRLRGESDHGRDVGSCAREIGTDPQQRSSRSGDAAARLFHHGDRLLAVRAR